MAKVTFIKNGKSIEVESSQADQSLLDIALENSVDMDHACGGNGVCTTCMVTVANGLENLSAMTEREEVMGMDPETPNVRLGCQCKVKGDCKVELAF